MTEHVTNLNIGNDKILNLDADDKGNFIAYTKNKTVITNDSSIKIETDIRYPIIRRINKELFLLASARQNGNDFNGFVYNFSGNLVSSFRAGDAIEDIVVQNQKIVASYFDEGVFGADGPNNEGLAVFDMEGNLEFGAQTNGKINIDDCYCMCVAGSNKILFYAYSEFKLHELNLDSFTVESFETPATFTGANALSAKDDKVIFHSSYKDKRSFFTFNKETGEATIFGDYSPGLTGIQNGYFLAYGDSGFTIIAP